VTTLAGLAGPKKTKMTSRVLGLGVLAGLGAAMALAGPAWASDTRVDGGIDLLPAASEMMQMVRDFDFLVNVIITVITVFVLALLGWVMLRYNRRANPTPATFTHNMTIEVIWTAVPVLILVVIAAFSFPLLFKEEQVPKADITIKAIGKQWAWTFEYPDFPLEDGSPLAIDVNPLSKQDSDAQNRPYLLAADEPIYVPLGATVELRVTASDVIHAFALPDFAVKEDAIPGRVNQGWFKAEKLGTYYGQCSELCGIRHAFMPLEVRVVERPEFEAWIAAKGGKLVADAPAAPAALPAPDNPAAPAPAAGTGDGPPQAPR
jgi:cytochrome c oxidase subunit II